MVFRRATIGYSIVCILRMHDLERSTLDRNVYQAYSRLCIMRSSHVPVAHRYLGLQCRPVRSDNISYKVPICGLWITAVYLPTTLVVQVDQSVRCVCVSVAEK